jgi:hypothetical protein
MSQLLQTSVKMANAILLNLKFSGGFVVEMSILNSLSIDSVFRNSDATTLYCAQFAKIRPIFSWIGFNSSIKSDN